MHIKKIVLVSIFLGAVSGLAGAHGEKAHESKAGPLKLEQKEWGIAGEARKVTRTIKVTMADTMRFTPDVITLVQGETVRIVLENQGALLHEFVIGTPAELAAHAALMVKFPAMEHDEPYMAHVPAGKSGAIVWTFNRAGEFDFACLIAGHFQAGMTGKLVVAPRTENSLGDSRGEMTEGEIRKIDRGNKKLTIKHGEIKNLDMPGMTMVFQVREPALLEQLKVGDKIRFAAIQSGGAFVVTEIDGKGAQ